MTDKQKKWIDDSSYEDLLRFWRFSSAGDQLFSTDESYQYFKKVMQEKKEKCDHVQISKDVGWVTRD